VKHTIHQTYYKRRLLCPPSSNRKTCNRKALYITLFNIAISESIDFAGIKTSTAQGLKENTQGNRSDYKTIRC